MNVLADRHHAGLLYSLQLLFEDRLGYDLYIPVGHEWWDEGYWRFGQVFGDDRLARQYLNLHDAALVLGPDEAVPARNSRPHPSGAYYTMVDHNEYPDRKIRGVTIEQFKELGDWEFIIATVQDNQVGFHKLAQENDARYVLQVGNRGQQVDWSLDPLALVSAEAPIAGRGVKYHQEYDKDGVFAYKDPPEDLYRIHSYVNCFERMNETPNHPWPTFERFEEVLPDFRMEVHGSEGRDGKTVPTTALADEIATIGFAWHDKPQGDGFGHVIHYLASIGRPLIGHASYYKGLFGEGLWEDGVTSINLDNKPQQQVLKEIRAVAADPPRHEAMCRAIRARVDQLVDFDAEEQAVRSLLEL